MNVQQILAQYWGLISCFLGGVLYVITHYKVSLQYAKKVAIQYMFTAEKKCESLILENGTDKLKWVVENAYNVLPSAVRLVVSKPMFQLLAQEVFDSVIGIAKEKQQDNTPTVPVPVAPVQPTQPTA